MEALRSSNMADDKSLPSICKRALGCFQAGIFCGLPENGIISATGFPRRIKMSVSPCSTSFMKLDAFFRKSVTGMVFIVLPPLMYAYMYIKRGILSRANGELCREGTEPAPATGSL
jgi:hypothetical protein